MFRFPSQKFTTAQYLSGTFPKPGRNVFTLLCILRWKHGVGTHFEARNCLKFKGHRGPFSPFGVKPPFGMEHVRQKKQQ